MSLFDKNGNMSFGALASLIGGPEVADKSTACEACQSQAALKSYNWDIARYECECGHVTTVQRPKKNPNPLTQRAWAAMERRKRMTTPQKMMMQSIVKFGAVTVFAVVFYIESVRPQIQQNIATQRSVTEANSVNARTLERMADSHGKSTEAQVKSAEAQAATAKAIEKIQSVLERQRDADKLDSAMRDAASQGVSAVEQ